MASQPTSPRTPLLPLTLVALGVVYGDIGTSPLYAMREVFRAEHRLGLTPEHVIGALSLIVWSLVLVISVKYLLLVLRADSHGEGGILILTSLVTPLRVRRGGGRWLLVLLGLFGTALLFGDGLITPAISVLSAVEGIEVIAPDLAPYVVPVVVGILLTLFAAQRLGSKVVGQVFGPVMVVWFVTIAALGVAALVHAPSVLRAVNPSHAAAFIAEDPVRAFLVLGSVFLVVTGGEALYADLGHFGKAPIRLGWFVLVLPALLLNYAGQAALLISEPEAIDSPFFRLAPDWALAPLVALATMAAIIASQALISGVFSLAMQAVRLGYIPRLKIDHTSATAFGQVYVRSVNWVLALACCVLVIGFRTSGSLAAAYGVAVTATMLVTTVLLAVVAREKWHWPLALLIPSLGLFLVIDGLFLAANLTKVPHGGWLPLVVALLLFTVMTTWRRGRNLMRERQKAVSLPIERFLASIAESRPQRVAGTAVMMHSIGGLVPPVLLANLRHNHVLHEQVVMLTVATVEVPRVLRARRATVEAFGNGFYQVTLRFGFMEAIDVPSALHAIVNTDLSLDPATTTYFLGRETPLPRRGSGMAPWREQLFAFLARNSANAAAYFRLPSTKVIELGVQVEL
ncbi:MAG TPA: potassium transporter Kup [Trueperaceae bacterium]|nr:potassium transporter Kup [Trueperaceae bacterium]